MMRIGIVLAVTPGYSETFFTSKIKGLRYQGHEVTVFAGKTERNFVLCPVKKAPRVYQNSLFQILMMCIQFIGLLPSVGRVRTFIKLEKKEGTSPSQILKKIYLNSHILKQELDWLHFGFATQAIERELIAKAIGAKMAVSLRGFDINVYPLKHPNCYDLLWRCVNKVHSISNYLLLKAYTLGLSNQTPFQIITPAVVMQELPVPLAENRFNNATLQIVTIARLTWIKGVDIAIEAMKILKEEGVDFTYTIIGDGAPRDLERYQFMVYEYSLKDHVFFSGKLTHHTTLDKLQQANIYVQSSLNEGFCNAVLEAQALGKLVIASNVGALPENVVDGTTGWLFPVGDAEALAQRIRSTADLSETEKMKVINAAKNRVKKRFTIEQQKEQFVEFYTQLP